MPNKLYKDTRTKKIINNKLCILSKNMNHFRSNVKVK